MKLYWFSIIAFGLLTGPMSHADDTEIYRNTKNRVNPNVIFLIDTSGSMAYEAASNSIPGSGEDSRLDIVKKSAVNAVMGLDVSMPINLAIMRFDQRYSASSGDNGGAYGGFVYKDFIPTDSIPNKRRIEADINNLYLHRIGGGTPITETLYEAYRYLTGQTPEFGVPVIPKIIDVCIQKKWDGTCLQWTQEKSPKGIGTQYKYNGIDYFSYDVDYLGSDPASIDSISGHYKSPVTATCQKNHIVIFTDGEASSDEGANKTIKDDLIPEVSPLPSPLNSNCSGSGGCTVELAYYLQNHDQFKDSDILGYSDPNTSEIDQHIYVHTVGGFAGITDTAKTYLGNIAKYGHPLTSDNLNSDGSSKHYYNAKDESSLTAALLKVFGGIANTAGNFAAPVVAVNAFNSLEHRDELYYSVFKPSEMPGWSGNIKRYKMDSSGTILDENNNAAINSSTGFFKDSAKSFWTLSEADGADVVKGGIANRLPGDRKVYTRLSGYGDIITTNNRIHEDTSSITINMLDDNLPSGTSLTSDNRTEILRWARGMDPVTGDARHTLADPLHGNPLLLTYRDSSSNLTDILYSGTNVGYIHAFETDLSSPGELWAFMPKELLPNLAVYQRGEAGFTKAYGIDGPLSTYHIDKNMDGIIDTADTMYLVAGMRRGGESYYALDISDKNRPEFVAQIRTGDSGFEELGQTWSRMMPATVTWKGKKTAVFFFGGGYDTDEDDADTRITHDKGNAIYMVKASTDSDGKIFDLLWKATGHMSSLKGKYFSGMTSGFAGDLAPVDNDGNGTVDLIYAADLGGRMWRFDIDKSNSGATDFADGGVIADFNDGTIAGNIRFYTQPDVVYTVYGKFEYEDPNDSSNILYKQLGRYQVTIGSGYRAGPLSTAVKDKIFVINDFDTEQAPATGYTAKNLSDFADYEKFSSASYNQKQNGFYYTLPYNGEKVLSTTMTVSDVIYVPTFRPSDSTIEIGCEPDTGQARVLMIKPVDEATTTERNIVSVDLKQGGIVPKPVLVFPPSDPTTGEPSDPVIAIGTEVLPSGGDFNAFQKTYWREN